MRKHTTAWSVAVLAVVSCGCPVSKRAYLAQYDSRVAAQARTQAAEQRLKEVRRRIDSLRSTPKYRKRVQLEQQLVALKANIERTTLALNSCRENRMAQTRPKPWVRVLETRVWDPQRQGLRTVVQALVEQRLLALEHCYRLHGWTAKDDAPLKGAVWVVFGIAGRWPRAPMISGSTFGHNNGSSRDQRASRLQGCVREAFTQLRPQDKPTSRQWARFQPPMIRIAQLLVFADSSTSASTIARPHFDWPWPRRWKGSPAQRNEICSPGEDLNDLTPRFSRPCARGLKCCYPCGIPGCASVCLPSCPKNIP